MWTLVISQTLWLMLPALAANMAPVIAAYFNWLPALRLPLDCGYEWHGVRWLGDHKTWRGLIVGIMAGVIVGVMQYAIERGGLPFSPLWPLRTWVVAVGFGALLGAAALTGDAVKSLIKRRLGIAPGKIWAPWDQIDMVLGVFFITYWFVPIHGSHFLVALVLVGLGSFITSVFGVRFGIKRSL